MLHRARHLLVLLVSLVGPSIGCRPPGASVEPTDTTSVQVTESEPKPAPDAEQVSCSNERFADYDWVPDDARLATSIQRSDPDLPAALSVLARMSDTPELQLPIFASLDFRNLGLQLGTLDRMLVELELAPAELIELQSPSGEFVWVWATDCPPAAISARMLDRFGVMLRADLERPGLRHGPGTIERFPFDLLALGDRRVALTLLGRGAHVGVWLHDASRSPPRTGADVLTQTVGQALAEIRPAPIRTVLSGESLLTSTSGPTPPRLRRLQISGTTWTES
jgi:hypothetical protein